MSSQGQVGRPRSEEARTAVLQAVDDLLLEVGYAAVTMKGIAESAGVARQTVYRWWSTKAEILLEASAADAREELAFDVDTADDPVVALTRYLELLIRFLAHSPAGAAYRALLGEAQHDPAVAALLGTAHVLEDSVRAVIDTVLPELSAATDPDVATARLAGPVVFWVLTGRDPDALRPRELAEAFVRAERPRGGDASSSSTRR